MCVSINPSFVFSRSALISGVTGISVRCCMFLCVSFFSHSSVSAFQFTPIVVAVAVICLYFGYSICFVDHFILPCQYYRYRYHGFPILSDIFLWFCGHLTRMKYVAAYMMCALTSGLPTRDAVEAVLRSVGAVIDSDRLSTLMNRLDGADLSALIKSGTYAARMYFTMQVSELTLPLCCFRGMSGQALFAGVEAVPSSVTELPIPLPTVNARIEWQSNRLRLLSESMTVVPTDVLRVICAYAPATIQEQWNGWIKPLLVRLPRTVLAAPSEGSIDRISHYRFAYANYITGDEVLTSGEFSMHRSGRRNYSPCTVSELITAVSDMQAERVAGRKDDNERSVSIQISRADKLSLISRLSDDISSLIADFSTRIESSGEITSSYTAMWFRISDGDTSGATGSDTGNGSSGLAFKIVTEMEEEDSDVYLNGGTFGYGN